MQSVSSPWQGDSAFQGEGIYTIDGREWGKLTGLRGDACERRRREADSKMTAEARREWVRRAKESRFGARWHMAARPVGEAEV